MDASAPCFILSELELNCKFIFFAILRNCSIIIERLSAYYADFYSFIRFTYRLIFIDTSSYKPEYREFHPLL